MKTIVYYSKDCRKSTISMTDVQKKVFSFIAAKKGYENENNYLYKIIDSIDCKNNLSGAVRDRMFLDMKQMLEG